MCRTAAAHHAGRRGAADTLKAHRTASRATCSSNTSPCASENRVRRQGIQHFVREQHAAPRAARADRSSQSITREHRGSAVLACEARALAFAQVGARFEDAVGAPASAWQLRPDARNTS
jgi:hypothetical protein